MESKTLKDFILKSAEMKKMQQEIKEGKVPDGKAALSFMLEIPQMIEKSMENLTDEEKEKMQPILDMAKKECSINNIFSNINNANKGNK